MKTLNAPDTISGKEGRAYAKINGNNEELFYAKTIEANVEKSKSEIKAIGKRIRCVQAHTSQADWTPDATASLWKKIGDPTEEWPAWSQPIGAHDAYNSGDKVSHNGKHWTSNIDANVWEPGVYGWTEVTE